MRLIDADKLFPDCMTKNGTLAISQSQIANAPTVELTKNQAYDKGFITAMKLYTKPQGDLIIREELKESFRNNCFHNCYYCKLAKWDKKGACYICGLLDNVCGAELNGGAENEKET